MPEPKSQEEMESTPFFKAGARAKASGRKLAEAISCLRPGCWQYDAFIAGYDAPKRENSATARKSVMSLNERIADADARGSSWLAKANQLSEASKKVQAQRCYDKGQYWLDRSNKLRGNH